VIGDNRVVPPLEFFTHAPQPTPDTPIWRFRPLKYFRDIVQKREFHFARADQFPQDEEEGIPPDEYIAAVRRLDPFALDRQSTIDNDIGVLAQDREAFFIHCWHRFDEERPSAWKKYAFDRDAHEHGVALCSRYDLLCQVATSFEPRPHVGIVQYGTSHLEGHYNVQQFITTKREQFANDRELRLGLWRLHPLAGNIGTLTSTIDLIGVLASTGSTSAGSRASSVRKSICSRWLPRSLSAHTPPPRRASKSRGSCATRKS
jgi:hypothetical protein